ncbi:MAG: N-acetyl-gamma-glutamyl-phosphate reductase [Bacteroidales bacterium]|nr:N-acetyl-gamma-glutamyl-phosphate reductase [Bacteroidales bacterium]
MHKIKVGIIGATGYTGLELVRILSSHPNVSIEIITSESYKGKKFSDIHNHFKGLLDYKLYSIDNLLDFNIDIAFLALPHGVSMEFVKKFGLDKFGIIDLSGDFRLQNSQIYYNWYKQEHICPEYLSKAVYGLPELFFDNIKNARLIANPGCYPTSCILPLIPLLKEKIIDMRTIIIDSKSGVTGAGAKVKESTHFPTVNDNFSAYGLLNHRHTPEIEQYLSLIANSDIEISFTPHLLPVNRGILSTIYVKPSKKTNQQNIIRILEDYYSKKPFVNIVNSIPSVKDVRGSNYCNIFATFDNRTNLIILISVIDNLVKGASGQAAQNMNIMFDLEESTGLSNLPIVP